MSDSVDLRSTHHDVSAEMRDTMLRDPDFLELRRSKDRISLVLTLVTMASFYGFIYLLGWQQDWLAQSFSGSINRGIPLGIGVIVLSWILTGVYVRWANSKYDALVERVKAKMTINEPVANEPEA